MNKILILVVGILLLPQFAFATYMCAGNNQIFTDSAACEATCTQKTSCTTGAYSISGNSMLGGASFNRILWGQEVVPNPYDASSVGTHNTWIDFQQADTNITGNITGSVTSVTSGISGGKLTWAQKADSKSMIIFDAATAPAPAYEITNNFRPIIGVSKTGTNVLNILAVNLSTNTPEIIGSIPISGGYISEFVDGTIFDSAMNKYVEISRVGTDAGNKSIMFFGKNFQGSEVTVALVTIIPSGQYYCPVLYDYAGNPTTYACDANNECSFASTCNEVVGTTGSNPYMCGFDSNGDGLIDTSEYAQCKAAIQATSGTIGGFKGMQACQLSVKSCDTTCPTGMTYVSNRDRCEAAASCPAGYSTTNTSTGITCQVSSNSVYSCTAPWTLSGTTCLLVGVNQPAKLKVVTPCVAPGHLVGNLCVIDPYQYTVTCHDGGIGQPAVCDPCNLGDTPVPGTFGLLCQFPGSTTPAGFYYCDNITIDGKIISGTLVGTTCRYLNSYPATLNYSCPTGSTLSASNTCIISPNCTTGTTIDTPLGVCYTPKSLTCPGSPSSPCFDTTQTYSAPCQTGDIAIDSWTCGKSTPGNNVWQCSPYTCQDTTQSGVLITDDPPPTTTDDDGTVDSSGQCQDNIEIFSGTGQRCRNPGLATGFMDCCDKILAPADTVQNGTISSYGGAVAAAIMLLASTGVGIVLAVVAMIASMLMKCNEDDLNTIKKLAKGKCHYVGDYCVQKWALIGCVQQGKTHCCFDSMLSRIVQEQGRPMISTFNPNKVQMTDPLTTGVSPNAHYRGTDTNINSQGWLPNGGEPKPNTVNCRGFTIDEFTLIDFANIDLSEWVDDMTAKLTETIAKNTENVRSDVNTRVTNSLSNVSPGGQ